MTPILSCLLLAAAWPSSPLAQELRVRDAERGCYGESEREDVWRRAGERLVCGERSLPLERLAELRQLALTATELGAREPEELLASVGVTAQVLAARREAILGAALPETWKSEEGPPELPAHLESLLAWETLRKPLADELTGSNWSSTLTYELEVTLPGDPEIVLRSRGLTPWMLPWEIRAGAHTRFSDDVRLSRAVLAWVAPEGPCAALLEGSDYWREGLWSDATFWRRWVGVHLDAAFSSREYAALEGWPVASALLRVDSVMTGNVNMQPRSMFFELASRYPAAVDELRWYNPLVEERPSADWNDLLGAWRLAIELVEREPWLGAWKRAGPDRSIGVEVVGRRATAATMFETLTLPAWRHAGFEGLPEVHLLLRRRGKWCATVFLDREQAGALITTARPGQGEHWLDALEFSFHPRGRPPAYGRVDAAGQFELRTL